MSGLTNQNKPSTTFFPHIQLIQSCLLWLCNFCFGEYFFYSFGVLLYPSFISVSFHSLLYFIIPPQTVLVPFLPTCSQTKHPSASLPCCFGQGSQSDGNSSLPPNSSLYFPLPLCPFLVSTISSHSVFAIVLQFPTIPLDHFFKYSFTAVYVILDPQCFTVPSPSPINSLTQSCSIILMHAVKTNLHGN